jgi:hypothetical protein
MICYHRSLVLVWVFCVQDSALIGETKHRSYRRDHMIGQLNGSMRPRVMDYRSRKRTDVFVHQSAIQSADSEVLRGNE